MMKSGKIIFFLSILFIGICTLSLPGCGGEQQTLIVYAGKGLKPAIDELKQAFEKKHGVKINVIYGGSNTLLTTIQKTRKGDVFIPGSLNATKKGEPLITALQYVGTHTPIFTVRKNNPGKLKTYEDLIRPGIRLAVGNKHMCAIGKTAEKIAASAMEKQLDFTKNITITGSTVNELLHLVIEKEVDASLIWAEMLQWPEADNLVMIEIPAAINHVEKIHVATLATATNPKLAATFAEFTATEGKAIFTKHGFGDQQ